MRHDALAAGSDPAVLVPAPVSNYGTPPQLLDWVGRTAKRIRKREAGERGPAPGICERAREVLEALCAEWGDAGRKLPGQLIHGDYGGQNLLFNGDSLVAILDFDFLDWRERIYELAYTLYFMMIRLSGEERPERWPWHCAWEAISQYNARARVR